jgi:hypothetical protein
VCPYGIIAIAHFWTSVQPFAAVTDMRPDIGLIARPLDEFFTSVIAEYEVTFGTAAVAVLG